MGKEKQQRKLTFKEAVEATPDVASGYQEGINAFGKYADKIIVPDPDKIDGSLDIDETTLKLYPDDNRWDYALCYDSEVFYIEVHSAITSEVSKNGQKIAMVENMVGNKSSRNQQNNDEDKATILLGSII